MTNHEMSDENGSSEPLNDFANSEESLWAIILLLLAISNIRDEQETINDQMDQI